MALPLCTNIVIISVTFAVLAIAAVCLRFRARRLQEAKYGIDDYLIVIGLVFAVAMSVSNSIVPGTL
ncbi:hypothetical protein F5B22DRAFT_599502 [Xylaria bambusicola]|uniref:uncharacterized protein n=1 Tax=Xylaria bambusicola TaxID=326684 RepID=UPI0020087A59|nr:uncharacterized protein F5B22DRAFT_599502 [Xylaria bambusicola]KAI0518512.1 hypothetical protein F5B22DRAFT_599502 [Xylaria bambusicola]